MDLSRLQPNLLQQARTEPREQEQARSIAEPTRERELHHLQGHRGSKEKGLNDQEERFSGMQAELRPQQLKLNHRGIANNPHSQGLVTTIWIKPNHKRRIHSAGNIMQIQMMIEQGADAESIAKELGLDIQNVLKILRMYRSGDDFPDLAICPSCMAGKEHLLFSTVAPQSRFINMDTKRWNCLACGYSFTRTIDETTECLIVQKQIAYRYKGHPIYKYRLNLPAKMIKELGWTAGNTKFVLRCKITKGKLELTLQNTK